jgi:predicted LPLAT superfamily acyltransferase
MKAAFYRYLTRATKLFGPGFFAIVAQGIATGYFLFNARRRSVGREFYKALYPEKSRLYHYFAVWRQFTSILLMSHMGNWEVAAHLLTKVLPDLNLMLYMGIRDKEEIEKIQKQSICRDGIRIIGVDQDGGSPFDIVEGIRFLRNGGLVSMAGDVVWRDDQRTIEGEFLGRQVRIPEAPFVLALVSGAPLIVFFAFRTPEGRYRFSALPPIYVASPTRQDRPTALKSAAQRYLGYMEAALAEYPYQWFHFKRFI